MKLLYLFSLSLAIIGSLNWGLVGLLNFDLVKAIFGEESLLTKTIYMLVGVAGIVLACISLLGLAIAMKTAT